jgi:hypothetical protein
VVYTGDDGTFLQAVAGDKVLFVTLDGGDGQRLVRLDLKTARERTLYRASDGFWMGLAAARAGQVGIELFDERVERTKVVSVPLAGGDAKTLASAHPTKPCYEDLRLAGVAASGAVVTDEIGCHDGRDDPGRLFAYHADLGRRLFGTRNVPAPDRLGYDAELRVVGDHWLTLDEGLDDRGPEKVFVTDAATGDGRRLAKERSVKGADLNARGDAIVVVRRPKAHPKRPFRVRFFPRGEKGREVASSRQFPAVRLCGRGLAILEWANEERTAQRLRYQDVPGGESREILRRPRKKGYYGIQRTACNERWYAWSVEGLQVTVGAESLRP